MRHIDSVGAIMNTQCNAGKTALVIGGGAPNSTLIAGALAAFLEEGISFDVISASGAGVVMGLLYTAPKNGTPGEALRRWADVGVADSIYSMFPVNYKIFKQPGIKAQSYRDSMQAMAGNPFLNAFTKQFSDATEAWSDWSNLMMSALSPSDLSAKSLGLCAHLPFIEQAIDFDVIAAMGPAFYINAFNVNQGRMQIWGKHEITARHVRAALSFPFLYPPTEIDGNDYIEGAALETLNFKPFIGAPDNTALENDVTTIVVLDILGEERLIRKPRDLYDAWTRSIITPLVQMSKSELRLFELEHNTDPLSGKPLRRMLKVDLMAEVPSDHWPQILDWSASNMQLLFDLGYRAGRDFCRRHGAGLTGSTDDTPLAA